jgi:hypothetical protein
MRWSFVFVAAAPLLGGSYPGPSRTTVRILCFSRALGPLVCGLALAALSSGCGDRMRQPTGPEPAGTLRLSILATGDAGDEGKWEWASVQRHVARAMEAVDRQRPVDAFLLLGDNFYPSGLLESELAERLALNVAGPYCRFVDLSGPRSAELKGACALPPDERHPVPILVVPGNHDAHPESIALQTEVVPEFVANWEMARDPITVRELGEGVSLILLRSMEMVRKPRKLAVLPAAIRSAKGPWRILVAHHPLVEPAGRFETKYREGVRQAIAEAGLPVQLALGGHHHALQILEPPTRGLPLQVVSGAGGRTADPAKGSPDEYFAGAQNGFARVDLVERGGEERLVVSLYVTPTFWLPAGRPELAARWSVALDGAFREESIR